MIPSPFRFERALTSDSLSKLALLSLRWALIDHVLTNCLKILRGLTDEEAIDEVFPQYASRKIDEIKRLMRSRTLCPEGDEAYQALMKVISGVRVVRDAGPHGTIMSLNADVTFDHRSKRRKFTLQEVLEMEELTNYAAHAALILRHELGDKDPEGRPGPLPQRPAIPTHLKAFIQNSL